MTGTYVAVVFDFDDTLVPDSTSRLLEKHDIDPAQFWENEVTDLTQEGNHPTLAFLNLFLDKIGEEKPLGELTRNDLRDFGGLLDNFLYPGIPEIFEDLRDIVGEYRDINIEFYIISGGLKSVIEGTDLVQNFEAVYASELGPDNGVLDHIKRAVTFTEKTRYLFEINKGITQADTRENPSLVNKEVSKDARRVPWENMIYVGDGLTDIPCFSLLRDKNGERLGVFNERDESSRQRALQFLKSDRDIQFSLPKYDTDGTLGVNLRLKVRIICDEHRLSEHEAL